ncbi:MAG: hypothetical protein WC748_03115 [Legionellales bacterium]|jgi:ankyrin repeat protein
MKIFEFLEQSFSFFSVRLKYGKFDLKADENLPYAQFEEKYRALKAHPDWIKWALNEQSLEDLLDGATDKFEKIFFLCAEFPDVFKKTNLTNLSLKKEKLTFPSLEEIAKMLLSKMKSLGIGIPMRYKNTEIDISEENLADLIVKSLEANSFSMFLYLFKKYKNMVLYEGSNVDFYVEGRINLYIKDNNKTYPWFITFLADLGLKLTKNLNELKFHLSKENDQDLYSLLFHGQEIQEAKLNILLSSARAEALLTFKGENKKTAFDLAALSNHKHKDKLYDNIKDKKTAINQALYHAAREGKREVIEYLLSKNQQIDMTYFNTKNGDKKNGLIRNCYELILEKSLQPGLEILKLPGIEWNKYAEYEKIDNSLLHRAVKEDNSKNINLYCENDEDIFCENDEGLSALDLALLYGHQNSFNTLMSLLKNKEVRLRDKNSINITVQERVITFGTSYLESNPKYNNPETIAFFRNYFGISNYGPASELITKIYSPAGQGSTTSGATVYTMPLTENLKF